LKSFDGSKYYFIENEGMAWGTKIGAYGKLFLTLFRVCAVGE
jgi:signal peptidase II